MEYDEHKIWDALKEYVNANKISFVLDGKEFSPINFKFRAPGFPFVKGDYCDDCNFSIGGTCLFDSDGREQVQFKFDCTALVEIEGEKEVIKKIKDNRIYIKKNN